MNKYPVELLNDDAVGKTSGAQLRRFMITLRFKDGAQVLLSGRLEQYISDAVASCLGLLGLDVMTVVLEHGLYDQYGDVIPHDLVILSSLGSLNKEDLERVTQAKWYKAARHPQFGPEAGPLLASAEAIGYLSENGLFDSTGVREKECFMYRISDCLKRWNLEDGFYHA